MSAEIPQLRVRPQRANDAALPSDYPGRPRLYHDDPGLPDRLERLIRAGASFSAAATACGVSGTTWARWRKLAKRGDRELVALFRRLDQARRAYRATGRQQALDELFASLLDDEDDDDGLTLTARDRKVVDDLLRPPCLRERRRR